MIYDITPPITESLSVWPGDTPPTREVLCRIEDGDTITLSTLRATVHLGAHADGPNHYAAGAEAIHERSLDFYLGKCQVIDVSATRSRRFSCDDFTTDVKAERVLFRTNTFPNFLSFNQDFAAFSPDLIDWLSTQGVKLIGIDTPSVDLFDSKKLPSHQAVHRNNMAILEGLRLNDVPTGCYELIALPLPLVGFDASPVRAILRDLP